MSTTVAFAGTSYDIPDPGDAYGTSLSNFLLAVAQKASVSTKFVQAVRVSASSSYSLATDDTFVVLTASNPTATLLSGELGRVVGVFGNNATIYNRVTIAASGGQTINGASSISLVGSPCGVILQFTGTEWQILAKVSIESPLLYGKQNTTNTSFYNANLILPSTASIPTVTNLQATTVTYDSTSVPSFSITTGANGSLEIIAKDAKITAIYDPSNLFLLTDSGTGIYFYSTGASDLYIKSRLGSSDTIKIAVSNARINTIQAWS